MCAKREYSSGTQAIFEKYEKCRSYSGFIFKHLKRAFSCMRKFLVHRGPHRVYRVVALSPFELQNSNFVLQFQCNTNGIPKCRLLINGTELQRKQTMSFVRVQHEMQYKLKLHSKSKLMWLAHGMVARTRKCTWITMKLTNSSEVYWVYRIRCVISTEQTEEIELKVSDSDYYQFLHCTLCPLQMSGM